MECSGEASFTSLDADTTAAVNVTAAVFTGVFSLLLHTTALYDSCLNPAEDPAVLWLEEHAPEEIRHRRAREAQRQIERERRSSADHCASTVSECRGTDCLLSLSGGAPVASTLSQQRKPTFLSAGVRCSGTACCWLLT